MFGESAGSPLASSESANAFELETLKNSSLANSLLDLVNDFVPMDIREYTGDDLQFSNIDNFLCPPESTEQRGRTVSVFICGTHSNSQNVETNVVKIYNETLSEKIIEDGAGSGEHDIEDLLVSYNNGQPYPEWQGLLLGKGIQERNEDIIAHLKNKPTREKLSAKAQGTHEALKKIKESIDTLNIVAHSRGAAEGGLELCHELENDKELKHIHINLFLLDPVPGFFQSNLRNRTLAKNVKNCFIIYAKDERSACFSPVIPEAHSSCKFHFMLMPGGHSQVNGSEKDHAGIINEDEDLKLVGQVCRLYAERFLHFFGTKLDQDNLLHITLRDLATLCQKIHGKRDAYKDIAQRKPYFMTQITTMINQILGFEGFEEARKVIDGNRNWFNEYFTKIIKERFPHADPNYLDAIHQHIDTVSQQGQSFSKVFSDFLNAELSSEEYLSLSSALEKMKKTWGNLAKKDISKLIYCAISEELQLAFKPSDLLHLDNRCYSYETLEAYAEKIVKEKINAHNQKIKDDLKTILPKAREKHEEQINKEKYHHVLTELKQQQLVKLNHLDDLQKTLANRKEKLAPVRKILDIIIKANNEIKATATDESNGQQFHLITAQLNELNHFSNEEKYLFFLGLPEEFSRLFQNFDQFLHVNAASMINNYLEKKINTLEEQHKRERFVEKINKLSEDYFKTEIRRNTFLTKMIDAYNLNPNLNINATAEEAIHAQIQMHLEQVLPSIRSPFEKIAKQLFQSRLKGKFLEDCLEQAEKDILEIQKAADHNELTNDLQEDFFARAVDYYVTEGIPLSLAIPTAHMNTTTICYEKKHAQLISDYQSGDFSLFVEKEIAKHPHKQPHENIQQANQHIKNKYDFIQLLQKELDRIGAEHRSMGQLWTSQNKTRDKKLALRKAIKEIEKDKSLETLDQSIEKITHDKAIIRSRNKLDFFGLFGSTTKRDLQQFVKERSIRLEHEFRIRNEN